MTNIKPLDQKRDLHAGWKKFDSYLHAINERAALVSVSELTHVQSLYPLAFAKVSKDQYRLVAILSLFQKENVFVNQNGKWLAPYTPAHLRSYPFSMTLLKSKDGEPKQVLGFDKNSLLYRDNPDSIAGDERFFTADGKLSDKLADTAKFLESLSRDTKKTQKIVDQIAELDILIPYMIQGNDDNELKKEFMQGLFRIDEKKYRELDADTLKKLQRSGALGLIYAQMFSLHHLSKLQKLEEQKLHASTKSLDLDEFFGEGSNDTISFDF